jgi:outer membrane lipoprotein LolB
MTNPENMFRELGRWFAVLAMSVLVVGCAEIAPTQREPVATSSVRACHDNIKLAGRFSAQYRKDGKDEAVHGSFELTQSGKNASLTLLSPLGQTIATIDVTSTEATLTPAGKPPRTAVDVDVLAASSLGWPLPVSGLREWLQGCAVDARGRRFVATPVRNSVTTPDGWRIAYPVWDDGASPTPRPRRVDLHRDADRAAAEISLRLVIDTWQPGTP